MRLEDAIRDFLSFLRRPRFNHQWKEELDWITITKLFLLVFVVEMLALSAMSALIGLDEIPHAMESLMKDQSIITIASLAIIVAPVLEELIFRLHLKYKWLLILFLIILFVVCIGFAIWLVIPEFFSKISQNFSILIHNPFLTAISLVAVLVTVAIVFMISEAVPIAGITAMYPFIFYLTALVFALVHIGNFDISNVRWYMTPFLVLPQFILALYLGYVRMRKHIGGSIYIHALNNSIPFSLYFLVDFGVH